MELDAEVAQLGEEISRSAEAEHKVALEELHRDILGEVGYKIVYVVADFAYEITVENSFVTAQQETFS